MVITHRNFPSSCPSAASLRSASSRLILPWNHGICVWRSLATMTIRWSLWAPRAVSIRTFCPHTKQQHQIKIQRILQFLSSCKSYTWGMLKEKTRWTNTLFDEWREILDTISIMVHEKHLSVQKCTVLKQYENASLIFYHGWSCPAIVESLNVTMSNI